MTREELEKIKEELMKPREIEPLKLFITLDQAKELFPDCEDYDSLENIIISKPIED